MVDLVAFAAAGKKEGSGEKEREKKRKQSKASARSGPFASSAQLEKLLHIVQWSPYYRPEDKQRKFATTIFSRYFRSFLTFFSDGVSVCSMHVQYVR